MKSLAFALGEELSPPEDPRSKHLPLDPAVRGFLAALQLHTARVRRLLPLLEPAADGSPSTAPLFLAGLAQLCGDEGGPEGPMQPEKQGPRPRRSSLSLVDTAAAAGRDRPPGLSMLLHLQALQSMRWGSPELAQRLWLGKALPLSPTQLFADSDPKRSAILDAAMLLTQPQFMVRLIALFVCNSYLPSSTCDSSNRLWSPNFCLLPLPLFFPAICMSCRKSRRVGGLGPMPSTSASTA